jgi:DNA polymerase-3 subunit delta'
MSSADGGRRVVIIDAVDEMNPSAANAVLKVLEEPPANAFLLLVCHQPARLLPTIRSRCRVLRLSELSATDLGEAMTAAAGEPLETRDAASIAALAGGSVGRALQMRAAGGFETYGQILAVVASLPRFDRSLAIRLAGSASGREAAHRLELIISLTELLLARLAKTGATGVAPAEAVSGETEIMLRLAPDPAAARRWAVISESLGSDIRRGAAVNLDPGALILDMFHRIQTAAAESVAA